MRGLPERVRENTGIPTYVADSPLECVAIGTGKALDELDVLKANGSLIGASRKRNRRGR